MEKTKSIQSMHNLGNSNEQIQISHPTVNNQRSNKHLAPHSSEMVEPKCINIHMNGEIKTGRITSEIKIKAPDLGREGRIEPT